MNRYTQGKNLMETFDSIAELLRTLDSRDYVFKAHCRGESEPYDAEWTGYTSYEDAVSDLKHGLAEHVDALNIKAAAYANSNTPRRYNDIIGFAPDVPAALMGIPENMLNIELHNNTPVITLYVDVARNANTDVDEIAAYGRRVVGLIKSLESQGISTCVYCLECMGYQNRRAIMALRVKAAGAPLDVKRLTFPLMSAAMLRIIGFDWYERTQFPNGARHDIGVGREIYDGEAESLDFIKSTNRHALYINHNTDFDTLDITAAL